MSGESAPPSAEHKECLQDLENCRFEVAGLQGQYKEAKAEIARLKAQLRDLIEDFSALESQP